MKTWMKVLVVTTLFGVPAFLLGPVIWPPAAGGPEPSAGQLPFFVVLFAIEALAFGLGISFLAFGLPLVRKAASGSMLRAWAMYLSGLVLAYSFLSLLRGGSAGVSSTIRAA